MPIAIEHPTGYHSLPLAEEVRQNAPIADLHHTASVVQSETDVRGLRITLDAAGLYIAADPQTLAVMWPLMSFRFAIQDLPGV